MVNDFETLYDDILDLCNKVQEYAGEHIMTGPEEDKPRYRALLEAQSVLHDVAHELEEHLAWD